MVRHPHAYSANSEPKPLAYFRGATNCYHTSIVKKSVIEQLIRNAFTLMLLVTLYLERTSCLNSQCVVGIFGIKHAK